MYRLLLPATPPELEALDIVGAGPLLVEAATVLMVDTVVVVNGSGGSERSPVLVRRLDMVAIVVVVIETGKKAWKHFLGY